MRSLAAVTAREAGFNLTPYIKSQNDIASWQTLNTVAPYLLLWGLTFWAANHFAWLVLPLIVVLSLFSIRCFSLMHDCGHDALFLSKSLNRWVGFSLGLVNGIPHLAWARDHAYHHKVNGDWDSYRSVIDMLSVDEYLQLSPAMKKFYVALRHPIMAIPGGFFYLAIKPRLDLLSALITRQWASRSELNDMILSNVVWIMGLIVICWWQGSALFLGIYAAVLTISATIFIQIFFVQHIFEDALAQRKEGWSYLKGALEGTSYLRLPSVLRWFTADIGFHNIHHLSERIPNYRLQECHIKHQHLLQKVPNLTLGDMLACANYILWDQRNLKLVTIADAEECREKAD